MRCIWARLANALFRSAHGGAAIFSVCDGDSAGLDCGHHWGNDGEAILTPIAPADVDKWKGKLRGKIVLTSDPQELKLPDLGEGHRQSEAELAEAPDPSRPSAYRAAMPWRDTPPIGGEDCAVYER